jgi:two-component system response regulator AtoC
MATRVLLVDDDASLVDTLAFGLRKRGYVVSTHIDPQTVRATVSAEDFDVMVTDLNMGGIGGIELCRQIVENRPDLPVIVLTAFGSLETAVSAIRAGAYDFISKPVATDALVIAIDRAARHRALHEEVKRLRREVGRAVEFDELVGRGPAMRPILDIIERVAGSEATVLVSGESGTGKEVVARAIHKRSHRHDKPFIAINCAAIPEALLESELFGHERGAFTDAKTSRQGLLASASGGTLLLDEIGDMPLALQPKLLRVLEERTVRPIGGHDETRIDVRFIVATNRDLESAIEEGRFREDLYYRINVVTIDLPPLRARSVDILPLAQHFVDELGAQPGARVKKISPAAAEKLIAYAWPGNVRELRNCIESAVALARLDAIVPDDLPEKVREYKRSHVLVASDDPSELVSMEEVERRYVARVMEAVSGNKTAAARILGIDRKRLYRMLDRLKLRS